jgi:hypothetical protein
MKKIIHFSTLIILLLSSSCNEESIEINHTELNPIKIYSNGTFKSSIIVALDTTLKVGIGQKLNRFFDDLTKDGYQVVIHDLVETQPIDLRKKIKYYYQEVTPKIEGVIFIGETPIPRAKYSEALSLEYYMDLDGIFTKNGNTANWNIGEHTGNVEIEIWTSILPYYESIANSINYINDYLDKNHSYRTGALKVEKGFINPVLGSRITTEALYNYQYKINKEEYYQDLVKRGNFFAGIDNTLDNDEQFPTSRISYELEIMTDQYDVASFGAHGSSSAFGSFDEWGSIIIDVDYARTKSIKPLFILDHSCNTANISAYPNLATEFLYNKNNNVLVYAGATAPQRGMGTTRMGDADDYEAELLTKGKSIGIAHFAPMTLPYTGDFRNFREVFSCQQILLGDGTLRLQEFLSN